MCGAQGSPLDSTPPSVPWETAGIPSETSHHSRLTSVEPGGPRPSPGPVTPGRTWPPGASVPLRPHGASSSPPSCRLCRACHPLHFYLVRRDATSGPLSTQGCQQPPPRTWRWHAPWLALTCCLRPFTCKTCTTVGLFWEHVHDASCEVTPTLREPLPWWSLPGSCWGLGTQPRGHSLSLSLCLGGGAEGWSPGLGQDAPLWLQGPHTVRPLTCGSQDPAWPL